MSSLLIIGSCFRSDSESGGNMLRHSASLLSRDAICGSQNAQSQIAKVPHAKQYRRCDMAIHWSVARQSLRGDQMRSRLASFGWMAFPSGVDSWQENRVPNERVNHIDAALASLPKGGG